MRLTAPTDDIENRILDSTERLLGRYGYAKMAMDDIARDAGLGRRTIYLHFASKEEVALCSIDRVVYRLLDRLGTLAASDEPAESRLRKMLVTRIMYRFDSVRDYYQSFNEMFATLRPAYLARREEYFAAEAALLAEVICQGQADGELADGDPSLRARTMLIATNSLLPYSLSPRELGERSEVEQRAVDVARMLIGGILSERRR